MDDRAALIEMFEKPSGLAPRVAVAVARALNEIAGRAVADIAEDEDEPRERWNGVVYVQPQGRLKNRREAAAGFRAWWTEKSERLRFDAASGRWIEVE